MSVSQYAQVAQYAQTTKRIPQYCSPRDRTWAKCSQVHDEIKTMQIWSLTQTRERIETESSLEYYNTTLS